MERLQVLDNTQTNSLIDIIKLVLCHITRTSHWYVLIMRLVDNKAHRVCIAKLSSRLCLYTGNQVEKPMGASDTTHDEPPGKPSPPVRRSPATVLV